jgi:hypothetical protein
VTQLKNNINIGWYGGCESCADFDFYTDTGTLQDGYENLISIIQIKKSGFVYSSWTSIQDEKQTMIWNTLPAPVQSSLSRLDFIKSGQGITKLQCGLPYIIEIEQGTTLDISEFVLSGQGTDDQGRVINCVDCPEFPPCVCE